MALTKHPSCIPPENPDQIMWRYMTLAKFVALLQTSKLYFSNREKLSEAFELSDPFEGSFAHGNLDSDPTEEEKRAIDAGNETLRVHHMDNLVRATGRADDFITRQPLVLINCWHMNDHESAAMWNAYASHESGIAIQTTYRDLCRAMNSIPKKYGVRTYGGQVQYIDYRIETIAERDVLAPLMHKRKSFEHEREFRAICWPRIDESDLLHLGQAYGRGFEVNLSSLVNLIWVSPFSSPWFADSVRDLCAKYGLPDIPVKYSTLKENAFY